MDFFNGFVKAYWTYILIALLSLLLIGITVFIFVSSDEQKDIIKDDIACLEPAKEIIEDTFYVDVKGAVKKPGVYQVNSTDIINDAITLAGGFSKTAYTKNINLSIKIKAEMVIYVYTKTEYKKLTTKVVEQVECQTNTYVINDCIENGSSVITSNDNDMESSSTTTVNSEEIINEPENSTSNETKLISINSATLDELMTLDGIGESKANNIIKYREEVGLFKTKEEIKNVSGIGEAAFEKIKDSITV